MTNAPAGPGPLDGEGFSRYQYGDLLRYCCGVLENLDVPADDARHVAECLLYSDLRGVDSHGVIRLPVYARRLQAGVVKARPAVAVERSFGAVALVNGDNGLGPAVGARAMETALEMAAASGIAFAGVRASNHFGAAGYYVQAAVRRGYIGCAVSNAPPNMAPFGGRERFLGTNPIAVGIPAGAEPPLYFDASTSVTARGKIIVAAQRGLDIPEGWAIDPQGVPTTNARQALAGAVLPFGGAKGSAISFLIDILCGVWTGAAFALHLNTLEDLGSVQNVGHVFVALRTDLFLAGGEFGRRMDEILGMLKASKPAPGVERVVVPGEPEAWREAENQALGIPLSPQTVAELVGLGAEVRVEFPPPRAAHCEQKEPSA
jgi:LDH2 family malate/lactate/ureidoglycolate dehydrogenase